MGRSAIVDATKRVYQCASRKEKGRWLEPSLVHVRIILTVAVVDEVVNVILEENGQQEY